MGHCISSSLRHYSVNRTENWMFSVIINSAMQSLFHTWNHCLQSSILTSVSWWGTCKIKIRWWRFSQGEIACYSLTQTSLIPSGLNLTVGCTLLSGCNDEIQSLNYLESPSFWAVQVSIKHDYIAEILEKVIYQQQNWVHNTSFVMRGLLLHFLFVIFTCNYQNFFC